MISQVQAQLEAIYGLPTGLDVRAFLVDDEKAARALGATGRAKEELLVSETGGELELALFLSRDVLKRLRRYESAPGAALERDFASYCQVAEGVSHFMYLSRSAEQDRRVSLLELEAQAEVDKFVSCVFLRWGSTVGAWAHELVGRLFDRVRYLPGLSEAELWRYQRANRLARAYAKSLLPLVDERRMDKLLSELRHCYRLGSEAKLAYLTSR